MFIENGFNDFISKPIDVSKLDEMLNRWIPKEKREKGVERMYQGSDYDIPAIPGVDTAKGVAMTGGTAVAYMQALSLFRKDLQDRLPLLQKAPEADTLSALVTQFHAIKSASASMGAEKISAQAAELEAAGKAADMDFINEHLPSFAQQLAELVKNISTAIDIGAGKSVPADTNNGADISAYIPIFRELSDALKSQKIPEIKRILNMLGQRTQDSGLKEILEQISNQVLITEFDSALKIIDEVLRT